MSAFEAQPTRSAEEEGARGDVHSGQRHDRIRRDATDGDVPGGTSGEDGGVAEINQVSAMQKMLSATSGSLLTSLLVTPLDVVRVRLQSQPGLSPQTISQVTSNLQSARFNNLPPNLGVTSCCREVFWVTNNANFCVAAPSPSTLNASTTSLSHSAGPECAVEETQRRNFTSTLDGLRKIARNEGITTLWRGLSPTLVMAVPANVIYFTGYEWLRYNRRSLIAQRIPDAYLPLVAGSLARVGAAAAISPIEMFRTRLQASSSGNRSDTRASRAVFADTLKDLRDLVRSQGYTSLWRGLSLTLWRDVPFSGLYWWGYEAVHNILTDARERSRGVHLHLPGSERRARTRNLSRNRESHAVTLTDSFVSGGISGAVAAFVTTPFDVGKTRQQVTKQGGDTEATRGRKLAQADLRPEERSIPRFLWHIAREEGLTGLWRGWAARCLKVAPACAIMISSYEVGKKMAHGINARKEESVA
ncbi:MAG: hypothetical protein M1833_006828 [Piccolia ochrophora]|nr:MAG: hypothetical protein M1833_006828 [Piccolia ochrophora]